MDRFDVYFDGSHIGIFNVTGRDFSFRYNRELMDSTDVLPISRSLPLRDEPFNDAECGPFFRGLLPEDQYRRSVAAALQISEENTAGLFNALGGECAGAVSLWPFGQRPGGLSYQPIDASEIRDMILEGRAAGLAGQSRLSLAGAHAKFALRKTIDNGWELPLSGAPSTHIVKVPDKEFADLELNEFFCMRLARHAGLDAAPVELIEFEGLPVLVIERYDRNATGGSISRIHQEDFCQATGIEPSNKYEAEGGPSLADLTRVLVNESSNPIADVKQLIRWTGFNYIVGNCDAHGKNASMIYASDSVRLAPFYDIVSTWVYHGLSRKQAMQIGGEYRQEYIETRHWERFATDMGRPFEFVRGELLELVESTRQHLEAECGDVYGYPDTDTIVQVRSLVEQRLERLAEV